MIKNNLPLFLETRHFDEARLYHNSKTEGTVDDYVTDGRSANNFDERVCWRAQGELPELPREKRERFCEVVCDSARRGFRDLPREAARGLVLRKSARKSSRS